MVTKHSRSDTEILTRSDSISADTGKAKQQLGNNRRKKSKLPRQKGKKQAVKKYSFSMNDSQKPANK